MSNIRNQTKYADENGYSRSDGWDYYDWLIEETEGGWNPGIGIELNNDLFISFFSKNSEEGEMLGVSNLLDYEWEDYYKEKVEPKLDDILTNLECRFIRNSQYIKLNKSDGDLLGKIVYDECKQYYCNLFQQTQEDHRTATPEDWTWEYLPEIVKAKRLEEIKERGY